MRIDLLESAEELERLRDAWTELLEHAEHASPFMTWEWQALWWKHYGRQRPLRVFVARSADRVVGILPLYIDRQTVFGCIPLRLLRNVGTGGDTSPDDLQPLIDTSLRDEVSRELIERVAQTRAEWDLARLSDLAPGSRFESQLLAALGTAGSRHETSVCARIPFIELPDSWERYLSAQSNNRRSTIRSKRRKLMAEPGVFMTLCQDPDRLDAVIDRLIELHRMRWQGRSTTHAFGSLAYCNFHRELMHAMHARDMLRVYCLEMAGVVVAVLYCYKFRDTVYYFQGGFDPGLTKWSPGLVLMGFAIENALSEGAKVFDMLRGEYAHKTHWTKQLRHTSQIEIFNASLSTAAYRFRTRQLPRLYKRLVRSRLRPQLAETSA